MFIVQIDFSMDSFAIEQIDHNDDSKSRYGTCRSTKGRACSSLFQSDMQQLVSEIETYDDPDQLFGDFGYSRRVHVLPALKIASKCREQRHEEQRRRNGLYCQSRIRISQAGGNRFTAKITYGKRNDTDDKEQRRRCSKDFMCVFILSHRNALRYHPGYRHRYTRCGKYQQRTVYGIGKTVIRHSVVADPVGQRNAEHRSKQFDQDARNPQNSGALNKFISLI